MSDRIFALQSLLPQWQIDSLIIEHPIDLFYLVGFRLSAGRLLLTQKEVELYVDGRYLGIAKEKSPIPVSLLEDSALKTFFSQKGSQNIGFDSAFTSYDRYQKLEKLFDNKSRNLVPISSPLKHLRAIKSPEEWEKMRMSAALTKDAIRYLIEFLKTGVTEKQLAWLFDKYCREHGAEKMAFDPIVAFGENTSYPHHRTSNRAWKEGEPVLFDVGCILEDYASDMTRMVWTSKAPKKYSRIYEIVQAAQKAALAICRPGVTFGELDKEARRVMKEEGVEEMFAHSLGHGIGLETHEYPKIGLKAEEKNDTVKEGMVITIEPGLYAAGICGVRYEDTVIVHENGPENLYQDLEWELLVQKYV